MNHWNPILFENRNLVPASTDPNYHLTTDLADKAIAWVRQGEDHRARPAVLPLRRDRARPMRRTTRRRNGSTSSRASSTAAGTRIARQTLARQKKLGVVPKDTKLTARSKGLPAWDSLNADQKRLYARMMEVFAGYAAQCDYELGRVVEAVQAAARTRTTR